MTTNSHGIVLSHPRTGDWSATWENLLTHFFEDLLADAPAIEVTIQRVETTCREDVSVIDVDAEAGTIITTTGEAIRFEDLAEVAL